MIHWESDKYPIGNRAQASPVLPGQSSRSRLHSDSPIKSNHLAIEHGILHNALYQVGILPWSTQTTWEGHLPCQEGPHFLRKWCQQRSCKQAWKNRNTQCCSSLLSCTCCQYLLTRTSCTPQFSEHRTRYLTQNPTSFSVHFCFV